MKRCLGDLLRNRLDDCEVRGKGYGMSWGIRRSIKYRTRRDTRFIPGHRVCRAQLYGELVSVIGTKRTVSCSQTEGEMKKVNNGRLNHE